MVDLTRIPVDEIDHDELRSARVRHDEAQAAIREARRAVERLQGGRTLARHRDAEAAVEARLSGKTAPRGKSHEQRFEEELADAERAQVEAEVMARRTGELLRAAAEEHGESWADAVQADAEAADDVYHSALRAVLTLHQERVRSHQRASMVGRSMPMGVVVTLKPDQLTDSTTGSRLELVRLDNPAARHRQRALVRVEDVLAALQVADNPGPIAPYMPGGHVAAKFQQAAEHAATVMRGYSIEEGRGDVPVQAGERLTIGGVPVHLPSGGKADPWAES